MTAIPSLAVALLTALLLTSPDRHGGLPRVEGYTSVIENGEVIGPFAATVTTPALVSTPSSTSSLTGAGDAGVNGMGGDGGAVSTVSGGGGGGLGAKRVGEVTLAPGAALRVSLHSAVSSSYSSTSPKLPSPTSTADTRALVLLLGAPSASNVIAAGGGASIPSPEDVYRSPAQLLSLVVEVWVVANDDATTALSLAATCALLWGGDDPEVRGWRVAVSSDASDDAGLTFPRCSAHSASVDGGGAGVGGGVGGGGGVDSASPDDYVRLEIALDPPHSASPEKLSSTAGTQDAQSPRLREHDVGAVIVREATGARPGTFIAAGLALVSFSDLVELSWSWLSRAAGCSSELYGGLVSSCGGVADAPGGERGSSSAWDGASSFATPVVTMDNLVNGCCAAAVAYSSADCTCALDVFATSSSAFFRPGGGAMAASRDVRAMERLSDFLLTLCGVKKSPGDAPQGTQGFAAASSSDASSSSSSSSSSASFSTTTTDAGDEALRGSAGAVGGGAGCVGTSAIMAAMGHLVREEEASLVSSSTPSLSSAASSAPSVSSTITSAGGSSGGTGVKLGDVDSAMEWVLQQVAAQSRPATSGAAGNAGLGQYPASPSSTGSPLDAMPPADKVDAQNAASEEASAVGEAADGAVNTIGNAGEIDNGIDDPGTTYDAFFSWLQGETSGDGEGSRSPPPPPPTEAVLFSDDAPNATSSGSVEVLQQSATGRDEEQREGERNTSTAAGNNTDAHISAFQKPGAGSVGTSTGAPTTPMVVDTADEKIDGSAAAESFAPASDENDLSTSAAGAPPALNASSISSEGVEETYLSGEYRQGTAYSPRRGLRWWQAAGTAHLTHI